MTDRPPSDTASVPAGERLQRLLFGGFLATHEGEERKLGTVEAVPAMGLDGLGSSAYGPEAALTVLLPLGALGLAAIGPIMLLLVALLAILYVSYRQTVLAYPSNGGAYTVAKACLLYTSPSPRDGLLSRMPSSA